LNPSQGALLDKARSSVEAAELLAQQGYFAFAVSRAYYAMFYVAESLLLGEGLAFSKHAAVIAAFGERLVKPGTVSPEFHRFLIEGQDSRNAGDYDIDPKLSEAEATIQIDRAHRFLALGEQHFHLE
jgi:uncharacterized protein (UPF0332 family)